MNEDTYTYESTLDESTLDESTLAVISGGDVFGDAWDVVKDTAENIWSSAEASYNMAMRPGSCMGEFVF